MGEAKRRLQRFQKEHPLCCFCGGSQATETIEHAPPKVFFVNKLRPSGLEFPACARCNHGSSQHDQVAALISLTMGNAFREVPEAERYWSKLLKGVKNNTPEAIQWFTAASSRFHIRKNGLLVPMIKSSFDKRLFSEYVYPWTAKQGFALWYEHSGGILTSQNRVWVQWLTNYSIIKSGIPDELIRIAPNQSSLRQGKLNTEGVFEYLFNVDPDQGLGIFVISVYDCAAAIVMIYPSSEEPKLQNIDDGGACFSSDAERGIFLIE